MVKRIVTNIICLLLLIAAVWALLHYNPFGWKLDRLVRPLTIAKTANVVSEIREISEFTTASYYEEIVLVQKKKAKGTLAQVMESFSISLDSIDVELAVIARGKVRAGYRLEEIQQEDLRIQGDSLFVNLPEVEVLDVIVNPSDYQIFVEEGQWSHEEITAIKQTAGRKIRQSALEHDILGKAERFGRQKMKAFFQSLGFETVVFE